MRDSGGHKINSHVSISRTAGTPAGLVASGGVWLGIDGAVKGEEIKVKGRYGWVQSQTRRCLGERGVGDVGQKQ